MDDTFRGDDAHLVRSIEAHLALDAAGALVPHGVGGLARVLLASAAARLSAALARSGQAASGSQENARSDDILPTPLEIAEQMAAVDQGSVCPLCARNRPHEHSPEEIIIYRNGVKFGRHSTAPWSGNDHQGIAQESWPDAGSTGGEVRPRTNEHHEHRVRASDPDRADDDRDCEGAGLPTDRDFSAARQPSELDSTLIGVGQPEAPTAAPLDSAALVAECAPYLKEGETPLQRIQRDSKDMEALLTLLSREKLRSMDLAEKLAARSGAGSEEGGAT